MVDTYCCNELIFHSQHPFASSNKLWPTSIRRFPPETSFVQIDVIYRLEGNILLIGINL
jgi:hypothetical protein